MATITLRPHSGEAHWTLVDDVEPDGTTTSVKTNATAWERDLYNLQPHTGEGTIEKVTVYARCAGYGVDNVYAKVAIKSGGTVDEGDEETFDTNGVWHTFSHEWTTPPEGGSWTWDKIDALQAGVSQKAQTAVSCAIYCTQVYVEVTCTSETETLRPNAAGDETGITFVLGDGAGDLAELYVYPSDGIHWDKVDEETPDEDETYVHRYGGSTGTSYDSYNLPRSSLGEVVITNVRVYGRLRRIAQNPDGEYPTTIGLGLRVNGNNHLDVFERNSNSYATYSYDYPTNPETGVAWTVDDIDNLQILVRMAFINKALHEGGLISGRCTQVYAVITYLTASTITTQAVTDIAATTATGNGNITTLGSPAPTAHGVCWNTTGTPNIDDDDSTDEGAASETGAFTSSITLLSAVTKYYKRAYAINAVGTSYGAEVEFTTSAGEGVGGVLGYEGAGVISIVETRFHYVDAYGVEYYVQGIKVP